MLLAAACVLGCGEDPGFWSWRSFIGDAARAQLLQGAGSDAKLPESTRDFYFAEGGNFNGTTLYWSLRCDSIADCWKVVETLRGPDRTEFESWHPSEYLVVTDGPSFYGDPSDLWDVTTIEQGFVYEKVHGTNDRMVYWAIDVDRCAVFYHYESGGFPLKRMK